MKPIKYQIASIPADAGNQTITEFINNTLARLNEDEAPVMNDMETHWELDSQFIGLNDTIFFVFALWTGRY
jgi:hypothetical protein